MSAKIPPTARPSGALYRPRKPLRSQAVMWNDDGYVVLVYGTHDPELARDFAQASWEAEGLDGPLPEPHAIWAKTVPWDAFGYGYDSTILALHGDTKGTTPTLQYGGDQ